METDKEDTIRAKMLSHLDRGGFYCPKGQHVEQVASLSVESHDVGRAKELLAEMAEDEAEPVRWKRVNQAVCLEVDSQRWTAARIQHYDPDALEWDQRQRLNGN